METEVELIKRDIEDVKSIHGRLDVAIDKLTDVSNCINRMLAVHEEKLARQEEASYDLEKQIESRRSELLDKIDDLHSRITTNKKRLWFLRKNNTKHKTGKYRKSERFEWSNRGHGEMETRSHSGYRSRIFIA